MAQIIPLEQAQTLVLDRALRRLPSEDVDLLDALGRTLGRDYFADGPWPTTDRSAMDGFAFQVPEGGAAAGARYRVVGAALAGHPYDGEVGAGEAVRIMTGGVVPSAVNAVAKVEDTSGFDSDDLEVRAAIRVGENIRLQGSEIETGQKLLHAGQRIRSAETGALAVLGALRVPVVRRPVVAILATGDEVVEVTATPAEHEVRDSNSWALAAQIRECGGEPLRLGIVGDDEVALRAALTRALAEADVLLTIGGVSKGTHDLVHDSLSELGVEAVFHGVALKPGKPSYFGCRGEGDACRYVFGLPGNPASSYTVFDLLVRPLLAQLQGRRAADAPHLAVPVGMALKKNWRLQALPAKLATNAAGQLEAEVLGVRPSGDPFGLLAGDGYLMVPADSSPAELRVAAFEPYSGSKP